MKAPPWLIMLAAVLYGFLLIRLFLFDEPAAVPLTVRETVRDTVVSIRQPEPLVITRVRAKVVKVRDTVIAAFPFVSSIDTIIASDTLRAEYEFPANVFSLELRKKPDSLIIRTITLTNTVKEERDWWEIPLAILGGALGGYVAGSISK